MVVSALAAVILLQPSPGAPTKKELLGSTPSQVVKMGRQGWAKKFRAVRGSGGPILGLEEELWWRSRASVNDAAIRKLPQFQRAVITRIRKTMSLFHEDAIHVGEAITDGGTMWNPMYAAAGSATEEGISRLLSGAKAPANPPFTQAIGRLKTMLLTTRDIAANEGRAQEGMAAYEKGSIKVDVLYRLNVMLKRDCEGFRKGAGNWGPWYSAMTLNWIADAIEKGDGAWDSRKW